MELFIACLKAFLVGGAICCLAELLIDKTGLTPSRILTLCVVLGTALGALGLYGPFAEWAGAGATVPLPGFGNLLYTYIYSRGGGRTRAAGRAHRRALRGRRRHHRRHVRRRARGGHFQAA